MLCEHINYGAPVNRAHPLTRDLVAWWKVLPTWYGGAQWWDLCGKYHGTLTNGASFGGSLGRPGGMGRIDFDGTNDYVGVTGLNEFSGTSTTVAAWLRVVAYDTSGVIFFGTQTTANCYWQIVSDTDCRVSGSGVVTITSTDFNDGTWRHLCMVATATTTTVYVNGVSVGAAGAPTGVATGSKVFGIGDHGGGPGSFWSLNGSLDDLMAINRALSADEVALLYRETSRPDNPMLNRIRGVRVDTVAAAAGHPAVKRMGGVRFAHQLNAPQHAMAW